MFVIDAIPLAPGLPPGTLSYRSHKRLTPGTLVRVPLRSKHVPALVISVSSVVDAKAHLKAAGFALRGGTLTSLGSLPEAVLYAARAVADYQGAPLGSVLSALLKETLPEELPKSFPDGRGYAATFIEDTYVNRVAAYKRLAQKVRSEKKATLIIAPTLVEAERLFKGLEEDAVALVTGALRGKTRSAALAAALRAKSVVVTTPAFSWLPIQNVGAIIIERPSANGYVLQKRPYVDVCNALNELAKRRKLKIIYGDMPLPVELRSNPHKAVSSSFPGPALCIDPREEEKEKSFAAVPDALMKKIKETHAALGRSAVLAVRKGYGSAVVCRDCGNVVRDERGAPLSLFTLGEKRVLRSVDGATKRDADAVCSICGSWNLLPLGVGVERVIEEIKKAIPDAPIMRFDADVIRTQAHAKAAQKKMLEPGAVVVGTESMLPFLDPAHPYDLGAIASADSLLALPFWRARERVVRLGLTLRERSKVFYIATRIPEEPAIAAILHPEKNDFFTEETALRKTLSYPPYGHLIVFHAEGTKPRIDEAAAYIEKIIHPIKAIRLADRRGKRGNIRLSLVMKVKASEWPNAALSEKLSHVPPSVSLHIDPESLW